MKKMNYFFDSFVYCVFFFIILSLSSFKIVEDKAELKIFTPSFSARQTLKIKLNNGLEAYLISDPNTDKSAAALSVEAGSWDDPENYPGLAHFLEHMLFLGTEKYPIESEFSHFIKEHNGLANAYTTSDHTAYLFSINNNAFKEALDRFSDFFKKPLFNPSGVDRELNAIDQEFAKNKNSDDFRQFYVLKELGNSEHPFHSFSIGNSSTLSEVSQETLKNWYKSHYGSNLMHLIVYSPLPIDELKKLVIEDFESIPNLTIEKSKYSGFITSKALDGHVIYIEPLKDMRSLTILWEMPENFAQMRSSQPEALISHVIGHKGHGSLLELLKKNNLAQNLKCSGEMIDHDHLIFNIDIDLTMEGLEKIDEVINTCFQMIAFLKQEGIPDYIFNEFQQLQKINYQYQDRGDAFFTVMEMVGWMTNERLSTFPEETLIIQQFDPKAIQEFLKELTPSRAQFIVLAPSRLTGITLNYKEKWIGIPYAFKPIPPEQLNNWAQAKPNPQMHLLETNPYIPSQLPFQTQNNLNENETKQIPYPKIVVNDEKAKIYFASDNQYLMPQIYWLFEIQTPEVDSGHPIKSVLTDLYIESLTDQLKRISSEAKKAHLFYQIETRDNKIVIAIEGFSENAMKLYEELLSVIKNLKTFPRKI